ncbi:hypothetical protein [Croceiramulus getboli]|nr:hypothetical protein P8624_04190 [Flavobacteriaceae bacterium YJPT1-3]
MQATKIIERYDKPFEYLSVFLKALIVYQFWMLWSQPELTDAPRIADIGSLMAFEFVMVHSGVFMAVFPKKYSLYIFLPFYGVFAWVFSLVMDDYIILIIYLLVVINRMRFAFSDVPQWMKNRSILASVVAVILYMITIFIAISGLMPKLGLDSNYLEVTQFSSLSSASGTFVDEPHTALAFGCMYYLSLAGVEILLINQFEKRRPAT